MFGPPDLRHTTPRAIAPFEAASRSLDLSSVRRIGPGAELPGEHDLHHPPGTVITVTPAGATGFSASGPIGHVDADGITVNLGAATTTGGLAETGASISFDGSTLQSTTTMTGTSADQTGLRSTGSGSSISASGSSLTLGPPNGTTTANGLTGGLADTGGSILFSNTSITMLGGTAGLNNHALVSTGPGSSILFEDGAIATRSRSSFGANAQTGGTITLNGASISTTGVGTAAIAGGHALFATGAGSQIIGSDTILSVTGNFSSPARAEDGASISLSNVTITSSATSSLDLEPAAGVRALSGSTISLSDGTTVTMTGQRGGGIAAQGAGSEVIVSDTSVSTSGNRANAVLISGGGTGSFTDSVLSAAGPIAVLVQDSGSSITLDNTEIEAVSGPLLIGYGLRVQNNAEGTVSGGSISTNGRDSPGIAASGGGFVSATDVTIVTSGPDNAMGVIADLDGRIELTGGSVTTTGNEVRAGARPHGLVARNPGGVLVANGTSVTTTGTIAMGVVADDGGTVGLSGNDILTFGTSSIGVFSITEQTGAQFEANATGDQLNIHTFGNLAHGVAAQSRNDISAPEAFASVSNSTVVTEGDNAVGLRAVLGDYGTRPITGRGEANVLAENTIVETHGAGAHGALSRDNPTSVTLNQTSILTTGFAAHGAVADFGGLIVGNEAEVRATGGQSAALYVVGNAVSNAIFTDSSLTNVSGPTIDVAGDGNVVLINTFVGGSGEWLRVGTTADFPPLAQQQLLRGVPDLPDPDPDVPPPTATPPLPPSGVTLPVPGFANIDVSDSLVIGSATTVAGSVSNVNMAGSTWEMTGNSNLTNLINDSSLIEFAAPTGDPLLLASYLTLTTVNYGGTGGILQLNTYLDTDGSPSDRLVIDGGTGSGSTALRIANSGGAGAVTLANGILVVDAINGATTAPGIFTLAGPVVAGPYDYSLFRGGPIAGFENDWFLRSLLDCTLEPNNPACDDPGPDPDLRPEVSLYAAIPSLALTYGRTLLDTLHERVGEEEDQRGQALAPRLGWGRIIGTHGDHEGGPDGILGDGPEYDYDIFALQAGADLWRREDVDGSRDQAGVYFAFGGTRGDVTHIDSTEGDTDFDAASLGGYWTHFGPEGWYVDGVLQGTFYDIESTAHRGIAALETDAFGVGASVEAGYPIHLDDGYFIEPQVQAVFQTVDIDDASDVGAEIHFDDADSLAARIGARLGRTFVIDEIEQRTLTVWLRPNIWNEFLGNPTTSFSSATGFIPFKSEIDGFTGEINAGISGEIDGNITLYANASYFSSADGDDTAFDGKIGLRAVW